MTKLLFFSLLLLIIFLVRTLQSTGTLILNLFCWWKHFQKIIKSRILLAKLKKFRITALATQTVCPQNVAYWPTVYKTGAAATGRIVATQFCPFQIVTVTVFLPWSRFSSATTTFTNGMEWCLRVGHHQLWSSWLLIYHNCLYQLNIYLLARFVDRSRESKKALFGCTIYLDPIIHNLERQS